MRRSRQVTAEEARLWRTAMKTVTPYKPLPPLEDPPPSPPQPLPASIAAMPDDPPSRQIVPPARKPNGVDGQTLKHLSRGERKIEAVIDLHGMTVQVAHAALRRFVEIQAAAGKRCLLVITGKGGPDRPSRLKHEVPLWLDDWKPPVLAVTAAQPKHGGAGALYVLLRRHR